MSRRVFAVCLAVLALLLAFGVWTMVTGARRYADRTWGETHSRGVVMGCADTDGLREG